MNILCLHSSGLSGAQWSRLWAALQPCHAVQTPDLLGYGSCQEPFSRPFHYGQDLDRLQTMLTEPSVVIGHSYGGLLALHLALRQPKLVRGLILFDPIVWGALFSSTDLRPESFLADQRFLQKQASQDEWLESFVDFWGQPGSWKAISERARESMRESYPKMREEVESLAHDRTPHTAYRAIECPTLIVTGSDSPLLEQQALDALHDAVPSSELASIEGGHMAPLTNHASFLTEVEGFLTRHQF